MRSKKYFDASHSCLGGENIGNFHPLEVSPQKKISPINRKFDGRVDWNLKCRYHERVSTQRRTKESPKRNSANLSLNRPLDEIWEEKEEKPFWKVVCIGRGGDGKSLLSGAGGQTSGVNVPGCEREPS